MRTLKTIECDKYEKMDDNIHVRHVGMITGEEAFQQLYDHLESVGLLPDEYFLASHDPNMQAELPDFRTAVCHTDWGGSEGIYIDISLQYSENHTPKFFHFATGKTLDSSGDAFLRMSRIAAECSIMLNGRGSIVRLPEKAYDHINLQESEKPSLSEQIQSASSRTGPEQVDNAKACACPDPEI